MCCTQPPKTQNLNLAWRGGQPFGAPLVLGLALSWLWLLWLLLVWTLDHLPPDRPPPDPPPPDRPKFRSFFPLPPPFRSFCVSLGVLSLNLGGFTRQPENSFVHISGPRRFKHHQNSTNRHPDRHKKSEMVAGEGKKSAKFWAPQGWGAPFLLVPPFGAQKGACSSMFFRCSVVFLKNRKTLKLGLAKVGQMRMAKVGLAKVGLSRGHEGWGLAFFPFLPTTKCSLVCLFLVFWWCFQALGREMSTFGVPPSPVSNLKPLLPLEALF